MTVRDASKNLKPFKSALQPVSLSALIPVQDTLNTEIMIIHSSQGSVVVITVKRYIRALNCYLTLVYQSAFFFKNPPTSYFFSWLSAQISRIIYNSVCLLLVCCKLVFHI